MINEAIKIITVGIYFGFGFFAGFQVSIILGRLFDKLVAAVWARLTSR